MYNLLHNSFINTSSLSKLQLRTAEVILFIALRAVPHTLPCSYQSFPSLMAPYLLWFYTAILYNGFPCCNYWASLALVCRMPYENKLNFCFFLCVWFYFLFFTISSHRGNNSFVWGKGSGEGTSTRSKLLEPKRDDTLLKGRKIKIFLQALSLTYGD